ncbi:hypothetical protein C8Q75DRAFT_811243 [Abortiporus biennis]|nr:hypothetical protein C8Q75DRAFT_811243 [Abortiporus biennis]
MSATKAYRGDNRKLVLAFDIGTTYSAVAYSILDPGIEPKIQTVTRYPGQENGDSKIPSVLYYTQNGQMRSAGAEAISSAMKIEAEDDDLIFVEWFKLHLRPNALVDVTPQPLPLRKSPIDVSTDFLGYLYDCARQYIRETHANGEKLWDSLGDQREFILTHPNGWEGLQQEKMREAAVGAGLIPDTIAGHARLSFVTEGEASLHYCLSSVSFRDAIRVGSNVAIIDAGGGTVDLSTYTFTQTSPISVEEIAPPGSKLQDSRYGSEDDINFMLECFNKGTKITFRDPFERSYIKFGTMRDNDPDVGIRRGQLIVEGIDMSGFFEPSVLAIAEATFQQVSASNRTVQTAFLVGGFASSPYLYSRLRTLLQTKDIILSRPDTPTNKAVAEGAISFYLEHYVSVRVAPVTYGTRIVTYYDPLKEDHLARKSKVMQRPSGRLVLPNAFLVSLVKGTPMREGTEVFVNLHREAHRKNQLHFITADLIAYRGYSNDPRWVDVEPNLFSTLCTVEADTSKVPKIAIHGPRGITYHNIAFKLVLICGLTEMKAQISWMHDGKEFRGPARIVYQDTSLSR